MIRWTWIVAFTVSAVSVTILEKNKNKTRQTISG